MSYRNPKQVVDTQSGQYVRDMLKSVTGSAVGAIKAQQAKEEKRQKELRENEEQNIAFYRKTIQAQAKIANSANAEDVKNSGTDWASAIMEGIDEYGELYMKSLKYPLQFSAEDALKMSSLANMGTQIKRQAVEDQADMDTLQSGFEAGPGQYGGFGKFVNKDIIKRLAIQGKLGATPGSSVGSFYNDPKTGGLMTKVTSYDADGNKIGTNANGGNITDYIVPNPTENMQSIKAAVKQRNDDYFKDQKIQSNFNKDTKETIKSQFPNRAALIADIRALSDGYIEGLGANSAIRLSNNKMLGYMEELQVPGGIDLGAVGNIIDPDKAMWDMDKQGNVSDPQLERIKIAYAEMLIDEMGLGKDEKIVAKINVEKPRFIQFQDAIKEGITGSTIRKSATERWKLQGEEKVDNKYNPDRQYVLPAIKDPTSPSKNRKKETVNYYKTRNGKVVLNSNGTPMINYPGINSTIGLTSSK